MHYIVHCQKIIDEVIVNFMIPRHTKFAVDGAFWVTKKYIKNRIIEHFEYLLLELLQLNIITKSFKLKIMIIYVFMTRKTSFLNL